MISLILRPLYNVVFFTTLASAAEVNVSIFGARADGLTLATQAIQQAIDTAASSKDTVVFSPGSYLTGALFLKSGVRLRVDRGVTLLGVQDLAAYPELPTRVAGIEMPWPAALLNVYRQSDVVLSGEGVVDGQGKYWWDRYWALRKEYEPKGLRWASDYDSKRVRLLQIFDSSNVSLSGLHLRRSGFWTVHICYSSRVNVEGVSIENNIDGKGPSTDGIDVDSSHSVTIARCDISCNDDAICMKAGRDADGLRVNRPTEHVSVRDCTVRAGAAGITFGSETSGTIRDIDVSGLQVLSPVPKGICIKSAAVRGGGVEDIRVRRLRTQGVAAPISITLNWNPSYSYAKIPPGIAPVPDYWRILATPVPPDKGLPHVRRISIIDLHAADATKAFDVEGFAAAPIEQVSLRYIVISAATAGTLTHVRDWHCDSCSIQTKDGLQPALIDSSNMTGFNSHQ